MFNLDTAVQQGLNRDIETNDWNVEATNFEVLLGDRYGNTTFTIRDTDNVGVAEINSDGYLSILGDAEVHGGHVLINASTNGLTNTEFITLRDLVDEASLFILDADPNGVVSGSKGSLGMCYTDGYLYRNADGSTDWRRIANVDEATLHRAYKNDADGSDAEIITDSVDGNVVIGGTEKLQVIATGGIDLDSGFDMDATGSAFSVDVDGADSNITITNADLTFSTVTSGSIINRVPTSGGDFVVDEGAGIDYLRAETDSNELLLGNVGSGTDVDVRVLSNTTTIEGDLIVNGTTTTVNTEELYVEDRLVRLNINSTPSFNGTVGIEASVGSDGYVEFHWDDSQSRWEISIDRNTTPEAQTFRPLPYLADSPATLDLSSIGTISIHNATSGAAVINTNSDNFLSTFGLDMVNDSVQAALEAIDGYLQDIVSGDIVNTTLQGAYDNDVNGGDATITTNSIDGAVVIAGTEKFQVTATGGVDVDAPFDMDGTRFEVTASNGFSIDGYANSNVTTTGGELTLSTLTSGSVHIDGIDGISLDANGNNVLPAVSCTDSLGDATHGWTDIYLCDGSNNVIALGGEGGSSVSNTTSGAYVVGTNSDNFYETYGPYMTSNTVQSALEAIDGYLKDLFSAIQDNADLTLQEIFDNSIVNGEVLLDLGDTNWHIDGDDADLTIELTDGYFAVNASQHVTLISEGDVNIHGGDDINITSEDDIVINGDDLDINVTNNITIDGSTLDVDIVNDLLVDATNIIINASNTTNISSNEDTIINGGDDVEITAGDDFNVNVGGDVTIEADGYVELDGDGIVLDSNGGNVIPADSCTDSLGDTTHGWTDIYLCDGSNNVIGLNDEGDSSTNNETSGANLVGTNSDNFDTFGGDMFENSVQAALEAIDGYLKDLSIESLDTTYTKTQHLDINGCVLNGVAKIHTSSGTPGLDFRSGGTSRASWSIPVPTDWDGVSDIEVEVIWSPSTSNVNDVAWRLEYKSLALTELATSAATNDDYAQTTGGTANGIQSTEGNLVIPGAAISTSDDIIVINIVRRGSAVADTYNGKAYVHLVKYNYVAQNIV